MTDPNPIREHITKRSEAIICRVFRENAARLYSLK